MGNASHYYRTLSDVTFTADKGVTVAGFAYASGNATSGFDYVRDKTLGIGETYEQHNSLENIKFKDLTITGHIDLKLYMQDCQVNNITIDGCIFTGATKIAGTAAIHFLSDSFYFTDVTIKNCSINEYFQGIFIVGVDGAEITKNTISNTDHNAVGLQSSDNNFVKGTVTLAENYMYNVGDRSIRFNIIGDADLSINNNIMVDCGNSNGQLIKAEGVAPDATIDLESNYWDGKDVSTAVSTLTLPTTVGITGGSWSINAETLANYVAQGVTVSPDGPVYVNEAKIGVVGYRTLQEAINAVEANDTIELFSDVKLSTYLEIRKTFEITIDGKGNSISPAGTGKLGYHAVYFHGEADATYNLNNIVFKDFARSNIDGPLLRLDDARQFNLNNVAFNNCDIANGRTAEFAIIRIYNTNFEADELTISNCTAGMLVDSGTASGPRYEGKTVIKNSTFTNNTALGTALIYANQLPTEESYLSISSSEFKDNVIGNVIEAAPSGRGVIHLGSNAYIDGCTFDGNTVYGSHVSNVNYGINEYSSSNTLEYTNNVFRNSVVYQTSEIPGLVSGLAMMAGSPVKVEGNTVEANNRFYHRPTAESSYTEYPARSVGSYSVANGLTTITSGTYNGALVTYAGDNSIKITGGTFTTDVTGYLADGYNLNKNSNGTYIVTAADSEILKRSLYITYNQLGRFDFGNGETDSIKLSLFAGVDNLNYSEVGFDVTIDGVTQSFPITVVYGSVKTILDGEETVIPASEFGNGINYIFGQTIYFPATDLFEDASVKWTPYAIKNNIKITAKTFLLEDLFPGVLEVNE